MLFERLAADLDAAGFTVDGLSALWGADAAGALERGHRVPALRASGGDTPLAVLARVLLLGGSASEAELDRALPTLAAAGARELGLVDAEGVALLDLRPYSAVDDAGVVAWHIVSDLGELTVGGALREDHVLGVGGASSTLSRLMMPLEVDTALDLGTGCGIQALHLRRHARRVVATDLSLRAVEMAARTLAVNAVDGVELRTGDLFAPVAGERFDHIVSNPPFVITPRDPDVPRYEYRDGGAVGDALVEAVVTSVEQHLEPGGVAQLLGNWEYHGPEGGLDRVSGWLGTTGLDAWIVERERQSVEQYAETWIRDGGTRPGTRDFDWLYTAWLDDFAARGVTAVGFGYVTLRRPVAGSPTLRRLEHLDGPVSSALGSHLLASLRAHDELAVLDDAALAARSLEIAPDVTERRHYWPGQEHPTVMQLVQGGGFARAIELDTALAAVVGACDGELPLGVVCDAVAQITEVDAAELTAEVLPKVRELVFGGLLRL